MKPGKTLIKNLAGIVTCDRQDRLCRNADILIEGARILSIGKNIVADDAEIRDGEGMFAYPGLVNTHHHFFQTFVRNLITVDYPNLSVIDWIDEIYELFKLISSDAIYYASLIAMADLIKHGCTTAFDHQYCYPAQAGKELVDRQMEAAELIGIRFVSGRGANTLKKSEGSTVPDEMVETTDEFLADCERLIDTYHDSTPFSMKQIVLAPCQPINCKRETFTESAALAREKKVRLHTHLGEGENEPMVQRWGKRTLAWCEEIDFIGQDVWYAHGWELTPDEFLLMGETGTGLSHCPAPAVLGGFPIIDMPAMEKAGMTVSLGCDGSATNDSSNLLDTLRMAYLMQSYHSKQRGGSPSSYAMLKAATVNGAKVLGRESLGSLEEGNGADLFLIDTRRLEYAGALHDPKNFLARTGITAPVDLTMVNGEVVYENGSLKGIEETALFREAERVCTRDIRENRTKYFLS